MLVYWVILIETNLRVQKELHKQNKCDSQIHIKWKKLSVCVLVEIFINFYLTQYRHSAITFTYQWMQVWKLSLSTKVDETLTFKNSWIHISNFVLILSFFGSSFESLFFKYFRNKQATKRKIKYKSRIPTSF